MELSTVSFFSSLCRAFGGVPCRGSQKSGTLIGIFMGLWSSWGLSKGCLRITHVFGGAEWQATTVPKWGFLKTRISWR